MEPQELAVIDTAGAAAALLDPVRLELLEQFSEPDSAAGVARRLGLPRQRIGYHVRELERHGFLVHVEDRRRGNCMERIVRSAARRYVISPSTLGALGARADAVRDAVSSSYLIAVAAEAVRDVARLQELARASERKLATLTVQSEIRFRSASERNAFAQQLTEFIADATARYHDETAAGGQRYRFLVAGYPKPPADAEEDR